MILQEDVEQYLIRAQTVVDRTYKAFTSFSDQNDGPTLTVNFGRRYAKIIADNSSAWGFIDMNNGDILKPAGWAKPAKHARGNINDVSGGVGRITWTGPDYLR